MPVGIKPSLLAFVLIFAAAAAAAGPKAVTQVPKFDGKFVWIKVPTLAPAAANSLVKAASFAFDVTFPKPVDIRGNQRGNQWFTFVVADQGKDWAWHQTAGYGAVPVSGGKISAGTYTVTVSVKGIPKPVLQSKVHHISLGPSASGLAKPVSFSISNVRGVK